MASASGLVAIVSLLAQHDDIESLLFLTSVIVAIMILNYFCLLSCKYIVAAVGPAVLQVVGRIMGVILAALAVELVIMGLIGLGLIAKPAASSASVVPSAPASAAAGNSTGEAVPVLPIEGIGSGSAVGEAS